MRKVKTILLVLGILVLITIFGFEAYFLYTNFTKPKNNIILNESQNTSQEITPSSSVPTPTIPKPIKDTEDFYNSVNSLKQYADSLSINLQYTGTITSILTNNKALPPLATRIVLKTKDGLINFTFTPDQLQDIKVHEKGKSTTESFNILKINDQVKLNKTIKLNPENNITESTVEITKI